MLEYQSQMNRVTDSFRLSGIRTFTVRPMARAPLSFSRVRCETTNHGMTSPFPRENVYLMVLQLSHKCSKEIWLGPRALPAYSCPLGSINVFNLDLEPSAYLHTPFDTVQFFLPQALLDEVADDCEVPRITELPFPPGVALLDPVVHQLGASLLPTFEHPERECRPFLDHVSLALVSHLIFTYGSGFSPVLPPPKGLAPWQERRAKEVMRERMAENLKLGDIARECKLSLSHFARAFKRSTGVPPHRWLLECRLEYAKQMMLSSAQPLTQIAVLCGFADQSHLNRVFMQKMGIAPSAWRRARLS